MNYELSAADNNIIVNDDNPYRIEQIAVLNDRLRTSFCKGGMVYHTESVKQLSTTELATLNFKVIEYDCFYRNEGEKRQGVVNVSRQYFQWMIHCYERYAWSKGVEKPSSAPECAIHTYRVMVIDLIGEK